MEDKYVQLFQEAYDSKVTNLEDEREQLENVEAITAKNFKQMVDAYNAVFDKLDVDAYAKHYPDLQEIAVSYQGSRLMAYALVYNHEETEDNYKYVVEVDTDGDLPNLFIKYNNANSYYYQEDMYHKDVNRGDYISYPFEGLDGRAGDNQLGIVIKKHLKYMANKIAEDRYGFKGDSGSAFISDRNMW